MTDQSPQMKMKITKGISFYLLSWLFLVFLNHSVCSAEPKARPIKVTINGKTFPVIVVTGTDGTSQVLRYRVGISDIDIRGIKESEVKKIIELSKSSGILVTRSDGPNGVFSSAFEHTITITISNPDEEKRLASTDYQAALVEALHRGIRQYFSRNPPVARRRSL